MTHSASLHLVDPELQPSLAAFPTIEFSQESLTELRAREISYPPFEDCGIDLEERVIAGPQDDPDIAVRIYRPRERAGSLGCIFHMHGGGFVVGSAKEVEFLHRPLAEALQCAIVSVDYRLAPETCFPGNVLDCYAALEWTVVNARELGIDVARVGIMGESAGGGLAASLALMVRDRGEYTLAFQHLIYPMLDDRTCLSKDNPLSGEFIWTPKSNHFGWSALLGSKPGAPDVSPYAAAARSEDLSGLPPTFISTAALDLFADEDITYAKRLIAAGVPCELHVWPGAFHGFDAIPGTTVSDASRSVSIAALRRFLATNG